MIMAVISARFETLLKNAAFSLIASLAISAPSYAAMQDVAQETEGASGEMIFRPQTANPTTICSNVAVPAGWVVTQAVRNGSCPSGYAQLRIEQLTSSDFDLTICSNSPAVSGNWIYTSIKPLQNSAICTSSWQEMTIHQVRASDSSLTYCNYQAVLPPGWGVNQIVSGTGGTCAAYQTMTITKLNAAGNSTVCNIGGTLVSPYVTTQVFSGQPSGPCKNYQQIMVTPALANGVAMAVCNVPATPVPAGFVVTGMSAGQATGPCASYVPQSIMSVGHLAVGSSITVCAVSPVPSGWIVTANNPWQAGGPCASNSTNTIRRIS